MADLDITNPLAVVVSFFGIILTALVFIIRFSALGVFGIVAGLGTLFTILVGKD